MSRRTALPGAAELFRSTGNGTGTGTPRPSREDEGGAEASPEQPNGSQQRRDQAASGLAAEERPPTEPGDSELAWASPRPARRKARPVADRRPTGRERHDEKITVYVSADELLDLEHARLALRGDHSLPVDRGRVVREALAVVLADFEAKGDASVLVRRLRGR